VNEDLGEERTKRVSARAGPRWSFAIALGTALFSAFSYAAPLVEIATLRGRDFAISHSGTQLVAFIWDAVCVYSVADPLGSRDCQSLPFIEPSRTPPRARWAPDDSALVVSAEDHDDVPGIWILPLRGTDRSPIRVHSGRGPGPGSGGDYVEAFLSSKQLLITPRYGGYAIFDIEARSISASCNWRETDGWSQWLDADGIAVGTNRLGDVLVSVLTGVPGRATLSCTPERRAESTPDGWAWLQFESVLAPNALVYSRQRYDAGPTFEIGARLQVLDPKTLASTGELPPGAPAQVDPSRTLIAAIRRDQADGLRLVVYRVTDRAELLDVSLGRRVSEWPLSDYDWAALRPRWSPDGRYVLVMTRGLRRSDAELVSIATGTVERAFEDAPTVEDAKWVGARLIVSSLIDGIRIYEPATADR
jgi:hypothetical protein